MSGWLKGLAPEQQEAVFALMRDVDAEAETHMKRAQWLEGNGSRIPVGAGHFDDLLAAAVREELLSSLNRGATVTEAVVAAKNGARRCVRAHNARRPSDLHWQRFDGAGQQLCEDLGARFTRVAS